MSGSTSNQPIPQILILGADGADGLTGAPGVDATQDGTPGNPGKRTCGWFTCNCSCAGNGGSGGNAPQAGGKGLAGTNGAKPPPFILKATEFTGDIHIVSKGGKGGDGGNGGPGGSGAQGGDAGTNVNRCVQDGKCAPAAGGPGGNASDGGPGGDAGGGGDGGDVTIYFTDKYPSQIRVDSSGGAPGIPGFGGLPGTPGQGGLNETLPGGTETRAPTGTPGVQPGGGNPGNPGVVGLVLIQRAAS